MSFVLDASAVLALILQEAGAPEVAARLHGARLSTVNLSEVIAKLVDYGMAPSQARQQTERLDLDIRVFDPLHAELTAELRPMTRQLGLSLGDRACLALGMTSRLPVLTSDRRMAEAGQPLGIEIRLIR